jgi:hypothetical protein
LDVRTEIARPAADRIDLEQFETAGGVLPPDFELRFFLEDADKDRGAFGMFRCRSSESSYSSFALVGN